MNPMEQNQPLGTAKEGRTGPTIGIIIVVIIVLILVGLYFWGERLRNAEPMDSVTNTLQEQSASDELDDIETDLDATMIEELDSDLEAALIESP